MLRGHVKIVELDHGYAVCGLKNLRMLYWIMDANDIYMWYVNRTDVRTHAQTKFSIEHTSVALAHARPTRYIQVPTTECGPTNLTTALSDWCSTSVRHHMTESQYVAILFDKPKLSL